MCSKCQAPQPKGSEETFFTVFSAPVRFGQDLETLQKRFYELSRALHPDRFARAEPEIRKASLERMSFLNEAYEFLKDRSSIREHLFSAFAVSCGGGGGPWMMELSERWFEVQESESGQAVLEFEAEVIQKRDFLAQKMLAQESRFDQIPDDVQERRKILEEIQSLSLSLNTLKSMIRDVQRLKLRMGIG